MLRTRQPHMITTRCLRASALVLAMLLPMACTATDPGAPDASSDALAREQVEAAAGRIWAAASNNDAAGILAEYGEDAIILGPGGPMMRGKPAITTYLTDLLGSVTIQDVSADVLDVTVSGDLAVETGTYSWTIVPEGGPPMPDAGKYIHVWSRAPGGQWQVIRYMANSDAP